jgi:cell wall-associated NlpC family hydrolase
MLLQSVSVAAAQLAVAIQIPMLTEAKLNGNFWIQQLANPDQLLLNHQQQQQWQQQLFATQMLTDFATLKAEYSAAELKAILQTVSAIPAAPRFFADGKAVTTADYQRWQQLMAVDQLNSTVTAQYAVVTRRSNIRKFPTAELLTNSARDVDLDRLQETAFFVGQWLVVLHFSQDRQWALVRSDHYTGWMQVADFALTDRDTLTAFLTAPQRLRVTGPRVSTNITPELASVSAVSLEMGAHLPLLPTPNTLVHGQHPAFSYTVQLPTRSSNGRLQLQPALIARHHDVQIAPLPLTQRQLITQAFKFLGERYGWGHGYQGRDCSGFIRDIYQTFALNLPRNTSEQTTMPVPQSLDLSAWSATEKLQQLKRSQAGDLLFIPGHVMMVLGVIDGEVWVIHDANGLSIRTAAGQFEQSKLNGVSVTPLSVLLVSETESYLDVMTTIQRISSQPLR